MPILLTVFKTEEEIVNSGKDRVQRVSSSSVSGFCEITIKLCYLSYRKYPKDGGLEAIIITSAGVGGQL